MSKHVFVIVSLVIALFGNAQTTNTLNTTKTDTLKQSKLLKSLGNGYLPIGPFDLDLRYLVKFNQYEGFRTGLGGITNTTFSENFRVKGYLVYGFVDKRYKYNFGGGVKLNKARSTWLNVSYTDDLQETGSSSFLTDKRFFTFFEPRLLNIDLFHRHITTAVSIEHKFSEAIVSELQLASSNIDPTYNYIYLLNPTTSVSSFNFSTAKLSVQWSPKPSEKNIPTSTYNYPKFTFQATQGFNNVLGSDFRFTKLDARVIQKFTHKNTSETLIALVGGIANGNIPLTHLYHAYPNNIRKETILQRFSVAGLNSFETMYFNEFFSDKFSTLQLKYFVKPFNISKRFKPQLVLISRHALGDMRSINKHQGLEFNTLNHLFNEAGFEINKLVFGFGLSFSYRYGAYYLPKFEDNFAFKFTFNLSL